MSRVVRREIPHPRSRRSRLAVSRGAARERSAWGTGRSTARPRSRAPAPSSPIPVIRTPKICSAANLLHHRVDKPIHTRAPRNSATDGRGKHDGRAAPAQTVQARGEGVQAPLREILTKATRREALNPALWSKPVGKFRRRVLCRLPLPRGLLSGLAPGK